MFNLKINKMEKELSKLTDSELMTLATKTAIETIKATRDGKPIPDASVVDEAERRGLKVVITTNFIRRVLRGEFDNADGIEVTMNKVGS